MSSFVTASRTQARDSDFAAREVIVASYRFLFANAKQILAVLSLPLALAAAVLLALFRTYFTMLAYYLKSPDVRVASLTVSVAVAGFLVWLLFNVFASARVARLMQGQGAVGWFNIRGMASEARLYAATLRYLLFLIVVGLMVACVTLFATRFVPLPIGNLAFWLVGIGYVAFGAVFSVRCGLLIPALAQYERQRVLRGSWRLSRGHFWQLSIVWFVVMALPAVSLQILGDYLTHRLTDSSAAGGEITLAAAAHEFAGGVPLICIVATLTLSSSIFLVLTTIGSCIAYSHLKDRS